MSEAFIILKEHKIYIDKLSNEETGELFKAIFEYTSNGNITGMSDKVDIIFEIFKSVIDNNEQKYLNKCKYNKKYYSKKIKKVNGKKLTKKAPPKKEEPKQKKELTKEQKEFIDIFKNEFPKKAIDLESVKSTKDINYHKLLKGIKESEFLMNSDNLSLKWCLEHSEDIINGKYKNYSNVKSPMLKKSRDYSKEELGNFFQDINEIDI